MTVHEDIYRAVATTDDLRFLRDIRDFIATRQADPNRPARGSQADLARFAGSISAEDAAEMTTIINREFNDIDGGNSLTPPPAPAAPGR